MVRISDVSSSPLLGYMLPKAFLNDKESLSLSLLRYTNNFGELLAAYFAIRYALKRNVQLVYGDCPSLGLPKVNTSFILLRE